MSKNIKLQEIMDKEWQQVRSRFFYINLPYPELTNNVPNGSADIVSTKIKINPKYITSLEKENIPPYESINEILIHEVSHLVYYPGTVSNKLAQYRVARQILSEDLAKSTVYAFNEVQTNLYVGTDLQHPATPPIQKILSKNSKGLNKILNALYQEKFQTDLNIKISKKEKKIVKELSKINFSNSKKEKENLKSFINIVKDYLTKYEPRSQSGFLGIFSDEQISEGLAEFAQSLMISNGKPNEYKQLINEALQNNGKNKKSLNGLIGGTNKGTLDQFTDIYSALARRFSIPIRKEKMKKNGGLIKKEQTIFSLESALHDINPYSSKGILPGITKKWKKEEGTVFSEQESTPDLVLAIDNSPSMFAFTTNHEIISPDEKIYPHIIGANVITRSYLLNGSQISIYSFGSKDETFGPSREEKEISSRLRFYSKHGGTTFNQNKLLTLLEKKDKKYDIAIISDMGISNMGDFMDTIKDLPNLHRIHLFYTHQNSSRKVDSNQIGKKIFTFPLISIKDIKKIVMGDSFLGDIKNDT